MSAIKQAGITAVNLHDVLKPPQSLNQEFNRTLVRPLINAP
jgi:hypothetical protein